MTKQVPCSATGALFSGSPVGCTTTEPAWLNSRLSQKEIKKDLKGRAPGKRLPDWKKMVFALYHL
jgi:hypothetical protein